MREPAKSKEEGNEFVTEERTLMFPLPWPWQRAWPLWAMQIIYRLCFQLFVILNPL